MINAIVISLLVAVFAYTLYRLIRNKKRLPNSGGGRKGRKGRQRQK